MPRSDHAADDWDDDFESDAEDSADSRDENGDDEPTRACPYCGDQVYEDSPRCPSCEKYLSDEEAPPRKPWWMIVTVAICLYLVYRWTAG